ncbi:uncharacterized protein LOC142877108 [Nelusetta ayraudi]|uniref:uncharacterized protein LOC142877108 n=1 Tax=Nelusetta ayraudi TaxID=303726 RepID=UPI003F70BC5A
MNLHLGRYFLLAGLLLLGTWAQEDQECHELVKNRPLDDHTGMLGKWYTIAGYTNSSVFDGVLNITDSSWINIVKSQDGSLVMLEGNKFNGTCVRANISMTVEGDHATAKMGNLTSVFSLLPSCDSCLVIHGFNTLRDAKTFSKYFKLDISLPEEDEEHIISSIYLMATSNKTALEPELEKFKKQAGCLGFTGEPDYQHDQTKEFCGDNEGIFMTQTGGVADQ